MIFLTNGGVPNDFLVVLETRRCLTECRGDDRCRVEMQAVVVEEEPTTSEEHDNDSLGDNRSLLSSTISFVEKSEC